MGKRLNLDWVTNAVGDYYKNWRKGDVVKIEAQTGTGKTVLVTGNKKEDGTIIPGIVDRLETYEKLIYICNRTELKRQIKIDLLKKYDYKIKYTNKDENIIDNEWLDKENVINNNIFITSYHAIAENVLEREYNDVEYYLDDYDYIICDECHYFFTDAGFNSKTELAFDELVFKRHSDSIKIFISATMDEVENVIKNYFKKVDEKGLGYYSQAKVHSYTTKNDYSYLDIKYFKYIKDIIQLIKNDNSDDKWMIFVTSKQDGEEIVEELRHGNIDSTFIKSGSKNKEKNRITSESKFNKKVLVTTKCLDNGINIKDEQVKNLIVMAYDKITFIQEIGRIRFNILDAPNINLYIPTFNIKNFSGKINGNYEPKLEDIKLCKNNYNGFLRKYERENNRIPKDIFYQSKDNKWKTNKLGHVRLFNDYYFAEGMLKRFEKEKDFAYIKVQLSWLNLEYTFDKNKLIENVQSTEILKRLTSFLEEAYLSEKEFSKEIFREKVMEIVYSENSLNVLLNKLDNGNARPKSITIFNRFFTKLDINYEIKSKRTKRNKKQKTVWIICKINE